jgi:hypothetical protein
LLQDFDGGQAVGGGMQGADQFTDWQRQAQQTVFSPARLYILFKNDCLMQGYGDIQAVRGHACRAEASPPSRAQTCSATEAVPNCALHIACCPAQGYGGNQAFGGGVQGGDQFTGQGTDMRRRAQEQTYGGDQTSLDAGGHTNFGVSSFTITHLEMGMGVSHLVAFALGRLPILFLK